MNNRTKNIEIAKDTLNIIKDGFYRNSRGETVSIYKDILFSTENSVLYKPDAVITIPPASAQTVIEVTNETTLQAARRLSEKHINIICLNFASARSPGGGFLNGSQTQEESLARSSGLYPCISQMQEMYEFNRRMKSCLYSDYVIYSPEVPVFKSDEGHLLDKPYHISFVTAPAVNAGVVREREPNSADRIASVMKNRIKRILAVGAHQRQGVFILGAFGCGVFKNEPAEVAGYFAKFLLENGEFKNVFKKVVFAVYDRSARRDIFIAFKRRFFQ